MDLHDFSAKCRQSVIFRGRRSYCELSEQGRCKYGMCLTTLTYYRCECSDEGFEPDAYGTSCQPRDKERGRPLVQTTPIQENVINRRSIRLALFAVLRKSRNRGHTRRDNRNVRKE